MKPTSTEPVMRWTDVDPNDYVANLLAEARAALMTATNAPDGGKGHGVVAAEHLRIALMVVDSLAAEVVGLRALLVAPPMRYTPEPDPALEAMEAADKARGVRHD